MTLGQKLTKYFNNHAETKDNHPDPTLETHYYKTNKDNALIVLKYLFKDTSIYKINSTSNDYGELSVLIKKGRKAFIVATVIMVRPYNTAIDFTVTTESIIPFDFGYSTKVIHHLYNKINKKLELLK